MGAVLVSIDMDFIGNVVFKIVWYVEWFSLWTFTSLVPWYMRYGTYAFVAYFVFRFCVDLYYLVKAIIFTVQAMYCGMSWLITTVLTCPFETTLVVYRDIVLLPQRVYRDATAWWTDYLIRWEDVINDGRARGRVNARGRVHVPRRFRARSPART